MAQAPVTPSLTSPTAASPATPVAPTPSPSAHPETASASPTAVAPAPPTATAAGLAISSVVNFRDVAGSGLPLSTGGHMATGVVYRSARLATISATDLLRLQKARIALVVDLRTPAVAAGAPDPRVRGAEQELVNMLATAHVPSLRDRTVAGARAYMRALNVGFATDADRQARIGQALKLIATADGPALVHCSEGKDRTGWISAILQLTAGAARADVVAEYLKSNEYRADEIEANYRETAAAEGVAAARVERAVNRLEAGYLEAGLDAMTARYGGIDGYLTKGLGLSSAVVTKLRAKLVA